MAKTDRTIAAGSSSRQILLLLVVLFAGSGCAALIYEVVWYQLLQLTIGATTISLGFLLASYMGGLCIGSIALPRSKWANQHPLKLYAKLELGIAICGLLVLWLLPLIDRLYIAGSVHGMPGMLLRGLISAICLLPPTILMGASLPAIVRWTRSTLRGAEWWGLLYGGNTAGAVFGCLLAGFYLLRLFNAATATYAAAGINLLVAGVSFLVARSIPAQEPETEVGKVAANDVRSQNSGARWPVYATIALSGATALGAEVVWTRLLGMLLGATVYVFSIILAVFLVGLALGSGLGAWSLRAIKPRAALGWCQILLTLGIAWTAYMIAESLPYWPVNPLLAPDPWYIFQLDLVRCIWAILPATILWGASFPLACAAIADSSEDAGKVVGSVYAANTLGAIFGALIVSLVLIPAITTQHSQQVLLILAALSSLFVLAPAAIRARSVIRIAGLCVAMLVAGLLAWRLQPVPGELIAYGRKMATSAGHSKVLYTREGRNSSVAITRWQDGATEIDVNGHVEASSEPYDMKLQRMVGHLAALLHPNPKSVLGIGFGAGVSAGTFTRYPTIKKITVCEIEPVIPPTSTMFFAREDYAVMNNPHTTIVYDDARHFVLTTSQKFDVIASDPLDVFVKGTAALYSKEYFESIKAHLNPGGIFTLYVPLYETDLDTIKSEIATFFEAFPHGTIWSNTINGQGYDTVFMGQAEPLQINLDDVEQRLARADYADVADSLHEIGVDSAVSLFSTYTSQKSDLDTWLAGAQITHDADLRLQYLGGWGINSSLEDIIYRQLLSYRTTPSNLFTGSPDRLRSLFYAINYGGQ
ncbi:MAG TPA: fused MFS/spermidine synthase [Candidatus Acidoferrales bacterium]|nr:fused MFS/spermidine synthase [Candidatus Acidoferrales bacterium]